MLRRVGALFIGAGLLLALVQVIFGLLLSRSYVPTLTGAHAAVEQIRSHALMRAVSGSHYWLSAICLVLAGVAIVTQLWTGQYRRAFRWQWWATICFTLAMFAFQVTGNLLPGSQHDVRTAFAEAQIAGSAPVVGESVRELMLSGSAISVDTFHRWNQAHLVLGLIALAAALACFLKSDKPRLRGALVVALMCVAVAIVASLTTGAPFGPAAREFDLSSGATGPMWYVLPMHALLNMTQSAFGAPWVGSQLIPALVVLLAIAAPFFAKSDDSSPPAMGRLVLACGLVFLVLSALSYSKSVQPIHVESGIPLPAGSGGAGAPIDLELAKQGSEVVRKLGCNRCHMLFESDNATIGPILRQAGKRFTDRGWLVEMLRNPGRFGYGRMPGFGHATTDQLNAAAEFVRSLK